MPADETPPNGHTPWCTAHPDQDGAPCATTLTVTGGEVDIVGPTAFMSLAVPVYQLVALGRDLAAIPAALAGA